MSQQLQSLLHKEVSRREFLGLSGLAVASVFGFGTLLKLLTGKSLAAGKHFAHDYSSGVYGGVKTP